MKRDLWQANHYCITCNAVMDKAKVTIQGISVRSWKCKKCDETVLHPDDTQKVLILNKLRRGISVKVGRLGQSLMMRLPKELTDYYHIEKGADLILKGDNDSKFEVKVA